MTISLSPGSGNQGITSFFQKTKSKSSDHSDTTQSCNYSEDTSAKDNEEVINQMIEDSGESEIDENKKPLERKGCEARTQMNKLHEPEIREISNDQEDASEPEIDINEESEHNNESMATPESTPDDNIQPEDSNTSTAKKLRLKVEREEAKRLRDQEKKEMKRQREMKKEQERHERELKKDEERKRKEEQKKEREKKKEEDRRQRELKKEEDKRIREQRKEDEKRKKVEEKLKKEAEKKQEVEQKKTKELAKERAQSRIGNFFKKSSTSKNDTGIKSDFEKCFLPFYVKAGVELCQGFKMESDELTARKNDIDMRLKSEKTSELSAWLLSQRVSHGHTVGFTAVSLMQLMTSKDKTDEELNSILQKIPHKYIKFYENIRPPYMGTYSKDAIIPVNNPFSTEGTGFNYEYDSDWDWVNEEEEEGGGAEDLDGGDDEDDDDDQDDASEGEFDGFLDQEETPNPSNNKKLLGPLIPTIKLRCEYDKLDHEDRRYFGLVAIEYLIEDQPFPVDPNYDPADKKRSVNDSDTALEGSENKNMSVTTPQRKKAKTLMTDHRDLLRLFDEVHESTFSLGTISEIAQKHLPQYSKETIKNTVKEYASRSTGKGNTSRKWLIKDKNHWDIMREQH